MHKKVYILFRVLVQSFLTFYAARCCRWKIFLCGTDTYISGVPKGIVLGPVLNDITNCVETSTIFRCFADDTRVCKPLSSCQDVTALQNDQRTFTSKVSELGKSVKGSYGSHYKEDVNVTLGFICETLTWFYF